MLLVVIGGLLAASCGAPSEPPASLPDLVTTTAAPPTTSTTTATVSPTTPPTTIAPPAFDLIAWLESDVDGQFLEQEVVGWAGVASVLYLDVDDAFGEFAALFPNDVTGVEPGLLPRSLRVKLEHPTFVGAVAGELRQHPGISSVVTFASRECAPFPEWDIVVFTFDDQSLTRIRHRMLSATGIEDVTIWSSDQNYTEFASRFAGDPSVIEDVEPSDLGISLRAMTSAPESLAELEGELERDPAVRSVRVARSDSPCV